MLLLELFLNEQNNQAGTWIQKVYGLYPHTWQNNHVMTWGKGEDQELAMFALVPNPAMPNTVEIKWFQAYPLRKGIGTRAMQELQRLAAEDGIVLTLYPWDKGQVSQAKLIKFYRSLGFQPARKGSRNLIWRPDLDEGWREAATAAAAAAALGYGTYHNITTPTGAPTQQIVQPAKQAPAEPQFRDSIPLRDYLVNQARAAGIRGQELAHLVAQAAHETANWRHMEEVPPAGAKNPQRYFQRKYDKKKILGNVKPGDGFKYRGRGYVQLTGRDNYTRAGRALGLDLVNNPDLAAKPDIAAKIALWFWKTRVAPRVGDFERADVKTVTHGINPAQRGAEQRAAYFRKVMTR